MAGGGADGVDCVILRYVKFVVSLANDSDIDYSSSSPSEGSGTVY